MRRPPIISWLALLIALVTLFVALLGPDEGPQGLTGSTGPQGIQGPPGESIVGPAGPRGKPGVTVDVRCPQIEPPVNPRVGAVYGLEQIHGGSCTQYRLVPIFGRDP